MAGTVNGITTLPRRGNILRVLIIARISTVHQDKRSLEDQVELCKRHVRRMFGGSVEFEVIHGQVSGEILDSAQLLQAIARVESGEFDLVITEDLARICRRTQATIFCETCEDAETRFIAINDSIDTAAENWRLNAFFASMKHEMSNKDTSERIRRSHRNRFTNGGVLQSFPYGYFKPPGAQSDDQIELIQLAIEIYREWFARGGATYWEIADWLNLMDVPTGPHCRSKKWTGPMVARVMHNPILKGWRIRNARVSKRVNKTGRRKSVKAPPEDLLVRKCPHLAVFSEDEYDSTIAIVDRRNSKCGRKPSDVGESPISRFSSWPGRHLGCGVCGRPMRYGGHGQKGSLLCTGAYMYRCWNSISVDAGFARDRITAAVHRAISALPGFDEALVEKVTKAATRRRSVEQQELSQLARQIQANENACLNITAAIRDSGHSATLLTELKRLETDRETMLHKQEIRRRDREPPAKLPTVSELRELASQKFTELSATSPEFRRWMQTILSRFEVVPVRALDGGNPEPRAILTVNLGSLVPVDVATAMADVLTVQLTVDLFDPPQRVVHREAVHALTLEGVTQREIARRLGIHLPTVQRACALTRSMAAAESVDPYVILTEPPADYKKMRRHLHDRFQFEPLEGFPKAV